ncbi:hypothetical protein ACFWIB_41910 [Streptomyces sp. NPDC127051]|uniref:hypothetical protein n=1 Tax=Streptomyces sp. NPDC127051 TaxID=3347119 RepID=UPI00365D9DB9
MTDLDRIDSWPALWQALEEVHGVMAVSADLMRELGAPHGLRTRLDYAPLREEIHTRLEDNRAALWPGLPRKAGSLLLLYYRHTQAAEVVRAFESGTVSQSLVALMQKVNAPAVPVEEFQSLADAFDIVEQAARQVRAVFEEPERRNWLKHTGSPHGPRLRTPGSSS